MELIDSFLFNQKFYKTNQILPTQIFLIFVSYTNSYEIADKHERD